MSLESVREKKSSKVTYAMIILLLVGMAGFGTSQFNLSGVSSDTALSVGDQSIGIGEIQQEEINIKQQNPNISTNEAKLEAIERASRRLAFLDFLDRHPYVVSREKVAEYIRSNPTFFTDGQFDSRKYKTIVLDTRAYEQQQLLGLSMSDFQQNLMESAIASENESVAYLDLVGLKQDIQFVTLDRNNYQADLNDDEIKAYFEAHKDQFKSKEQVNLKYIEISKDVLEKSYTISNEEKDKAYQEYLDKHNANATRSADYILFKKENLADAQKAYQAINSGEKTFDEEKKIVSDIADTGTVGPSTKGEGVSKELDEAMFAIKKVSDVAGPIESEDGVFIIKLTQMSELAKSKEEMSDQLESLAKQYRAEKDFADLTKKAEDVIYASDSVTVDSISKAIDLAVKETGLVNVDANIAILKEPEVSKIIKDKEKVEIGKLQAPVIKEGERLYVYEVDQIEAPKEQGFDVVKDDVKAKADNEKTAENIEKAATEIADMIKEEGIQKVASDKNLVIQSVKDLNQETKNDQLDPIVMYHMLSALPELGNQNVKVESNLKGGRVIYIVDHVSFADQVDDTEKENALKGIITQSGQLELSSFVNSVTSEAKIKQHTSVLNQE